MRLTSLRLSALMLPTLAVLAGCDVPNVPLVGPSNAPTITGQLKSGATTNMRVGLLGAKTAGAAQREIATAPVGTGGSYSLTLPSSPPLDLMVNANESALFTLSAYEDVNKNGRYDTTDTLSSASAQSGTFRFFVDDGPAGSYKTGWNLYKDGQYVQSFDTAFVLQGLR